MAKKRKSKKTARQSRVDVINTRANALRSALGFAPDFTLSEGRQATYTPSPASQGTKGRFLPASAPADTSNAKQNTSQHRPWLFKAFDATPLTICAARQARKEIIHAFNHAGKSGQNKPVRTSTSNIICKGK